MTRLHSTTSRTGERTTTRRTFLQVAGALGALAAAGSSTPAWAASRATTATSPSGWPSDLPGTLLDETFAFMVDFDPRGLTASGWELRDLAGRISYAFGTWMRTQDASPELGTGLYKTFRAVTAGRLIWDFRFEPLSPIDGASFMLTSAGRPAVVLAVADGELTYVVDAGPVSLTAVVEGDVYGVRVITDLTARTVDVIVNGASLVSGAALSSDRGTLDGVHLTSGTDAAGDMYLGPIRIVANHELMEDFVAVAPGSVPDHWTTSGEVTVVDVSHSRRADNFCAAIASSTASTTTIPMPPVEQPFVAEVAFLAESVPGGLEMVITPGSGIEVRLKVASSQLWMRASGGGDRQASFVNFANRIWHHVRVIVSGGVADLWHNGKKRLTGIVLPTVSGGSPGVAISLPGGGRVLVDDLRVRAWNGYPDDYVPEPQPVATGDQLIGVQSCNLWREGYHRGWDVINPHRERRPLLGYYDEGDPEVADWETKWLAENGVGFQMYCWYRPQGGKGTPIKMPRLGMHLHEGYFASRWSEHTRFMIQWENSGEPTDSEDFRRHLVPFWLEYYFKDPRYLLIDGRPVLAIYSMGKLVEHFGSVTAARAELDHLEGVVVSAGFPGLAVIGNSAGTFPDLQLDGEYSYTRKGYFDTQTAAMLQRRQSTPTDVLPTVAHGRNDVAWNGPGGEYATPQVFERILRWAKDEFMPAAPDGALSRRLLLLANWNEFGEGHFLFPSALAGFGYLEAVRHVFGATPGPVNVAPTPAQARRVGVLYPEGRVLPAAVGEEPPKTDEFTYAWTFDTDGDLEGWTDLHGTIDGLRVEGGALRGTATTADPVVATPAGLALDAADHPYVRVRLRTSVPTEQELYFAQTDRPDFSRERGIVFHADPDPDGWVEVDVPMWRCPTWQGTISQLRIDPLVTAGDFAIEEVRVMRSPSPPPRVVINGQRRSDVPIEAGGGGVLVAALPVMKVLGRRVEWDPTTLALRVLNGQSIVETTIGRRAGRLDDRRFVTRVAPQLDEHGWPMLSPAFFTETMGATAEWDGTTLTLDVPPPPVTTFRVAPDGSGDYLSPALAVAAVVDSGPERPYVIEVEAGTYTETEWTVPPYVTIRGTNRDTCVLAGALPDDATDAAISSTSTVWLKQTATLENLTITARNMRYAVHSESSGNNRDASHLVRNCHIEHAGNDGARTWRRAHPESGLSASAVWSSDRPWGYGSASGLTAEFVDCTFVGVKEPWYVHTNKDFAAPNVNTLSGCTFRQTGPLTASALTVQSLGSGQRDVVTISGSVFNGVYLRHDDRPWISERAERQLANHAEIALTLTDCTPLGYRPNLRGRALRLTALDAATDATIAVGGSAAAVLFGSPTVRPGGGGVAGYVFGSWDISGILAGLRNDVAVANTLGRRLGDCRSAPLELVVTAGSAGPVVVPLAEDFTGADNQTVIGLINQALDGLAVASEYDVGAGETYPAFTDREVQGVNVGAAGIARWSAVAVVDGGITLVASGPAGGISIEQLAPGRSGRVLLAGIMWKAQLRGLEDTTIPQGATVYLSDDRPGEFALTGTRVFGQAVIDDWVPFDLR
ncbi:stalk domain-containing protein [Jiangella endophytica]|uniref:stalk domain-containing protein n=1 Tax=Jiangella endophytica TaxID=1623398 RepID=UPI000E34CD6E|nr:stalk domain-containing protein [Jiangella endophytica]